jgi:diguanylate cyclase (GGDEF)-like protein
MRYASPHANTLSVVEAGTARLRNETVAIALGLAIIALGFLVDITTGRDLSLSLVYVSGVAFMAWVGSFRVGLIGAAGAAAAIATDSLTHSESAGVAASNAATALVLLVAVAAIVDRLRKSLVREASQARFDLLTGLPNRRACEERGALELARLQRSGQALSVAYLDFDGLKRINDNGGHAAGDAALIHFASIACSELRPTDLLSRIGGDEFVLLLPDTDYDEATTVIRRIQRRVSESDGGEPTSITVGLVTWRSAPQNVEQLFVEADALMYSAKRNRENGVHLESQVIG